MYVVIWYASSINTAHTHYTRRKWCEILLQWLDKSGKQHAAIDFMNPLYQYVFAADGRDGFE